MASLGSVSFMTNASTSPKLWALSWAISASQLRICNCFPLKTQHQSIGFGYNSHTPHKSMPSLGPESFMNNASTSPKLWALDRARTTISAQLRSCNGFPLKTPHQIVGFGFNSHTPHETMPSSGPVSFMTKTSTSTKLWALGWARNAVSATQLRICNCFPLKTRYRRVGFGYNAHTVHETMASLGRVSFMTNASTSAKLYAYYI